MLEKLKGFFGKLKEVKEQSNTTPVATTTETLIEASTPSPFVEQMEQKAKTKKPRKPRTPKPAAEKKPRKPRKKKVENESV